MSTSNADVQAPALDEGAGDLDGPDSGRRPASCTADSSRTFSTEGVDRLYVASVNGVTGTIAATDTAPKIAMPQRR
jgi:hypothetical protein